MDTGGTKLLGGVVDEGLAVRDRVHRLWRGGGRRDVLDMIVDAVEEARAAAPDVAAVGFGIPALVDPRQRRGRLQRAPPAGRAALSRPDARAARGAGPRGQRLEPGGARRAAGGGRARRRTRRDADAGDRHRRRPDPRRSPLPRGTRRRWGARPRGRGHERSALSGRLPESRLPRGDGVRHRDRSRGRGCRRARAGVGSGRRAARRPRDHRRAGHRAGPRRRRDRAPRSCRWWASGSGWGWPASSTR